MGKVEETIRSEIIRLTKREMRKVTVPLTRDVRTMKTTVSQLRKIVSGLERFAARRENETYSEKARLEASPAELEKSRFSPRLIRVLRQRLGITQKELATLAGVTVGAIFQWEKGMFEPRNEKKSALVALRKLGRREVKKLLQEKRREKAAEKVPASKNKRRTKKRIMRRAQK